jgi:hypothetical protein
MVTPPDIEAQILRFHHAEKWTIGTIARMPDVDHVATASPWRRSSRAWKTTRRSASITWRWYSSALHPAISYRRLTQLFLHLYGLQISEGALDAMLQRAKPCFDNEVAAILGRLRRSRIVGCDETTERNNGRTHWNGVFQNDEVVSHVVRNSRAASVVTETMAGHRPNI